MSDRLEAARVAVTELLYDPDLVTWNSDNTYTVHRPGGADFVVMRTGGGDWAVYHPGSTPQHRIPEQGIPGTYSSAPDYAIAWVLLDPWGSS
jgi:hypothetical protein